MASYLHPTQCNECNYLYFFDSMLIYVSERSLKSSVDFYDKQFYANILNIPGYRHQYPSITRWHLMICKGLINKIIEAEPHVKYMKNRRIDTYTWNEMFTKTSPCTHLLFVGSANVSIWNQLIAAVWDQIFALREQTGGCHTVITPESWQSHSDAAVDVIWHVK